MALREAVLFGVLMLGISGIPGAGGARAQDTVISVDTVMRLAPAYAAPVAHTVKSGTRVQTHERHEAWVRVSVGEHTGWMPSADTLGMNFFLRSDPQFPATCFHIHPALLGEFNAAQMALLDHYARHAGPASHVPDSDAPLPGISAGRP